MSLTCRARRIHDAKRMKAKAKRLRPDHPKAHYWADYLTPCSCHMCRNPRRSNLFKGDGKLTIQERKANEYANY